MACTKFLRTDLNPTANSGGIWTYLGYNASVSTGPWGANPASPPSGVPAPSVVMTGDNPSISVSGSTSAGFYAFQYSSGTVPCDDTSVTRVQVSTVQCSGNDFEIDLCSDASPYNLIADWNTGSPCGGVSVGTISNPTSPSGPGGTNYTLGKGTVLFNTGNDAGEHVLINTNTASTSPGFSLECVGCTDTATATINVSTAYSPGVIKYAPYYSVCTDPVCSVNLRDLIDFLGSDPGHLNGRWTYIGPSPVILSINGGAYVSRSPGYVVSASSVSVLVNFSNATEGVEYEFQYTTSPGLMCERNLNVKVLVGPGPEAGTPPTFGIQCWHDFRDGYLGGNPVMNMWDQLGGSPSTAGSWTVATSVVIPSYTAAIGTSWDQNVTTGLSSGIDDTFDFGNFMDTGWVGGTALGVGRALTFTFCYTAALPGTYLCAECAPETTCYSIPMRISYAPGTTSYGTSGTAYQCTSGCTVDLFTLLTGADEGGYWRIASSSPTVNQLIVNSGAPTNYTAGSTITSNTDDIPLRSHAVSDFTNVPAGIYSFTYIGGIVPCTEETTVFVEVVCPCVEFDFATDISNTIDDPLLSNQTIDSFIVGATEYVPVPISLAGPIAYGTNVNGQTVVTDLRVALNAIGVPNFAFTHSDTSTLSGGVITFNTRYLHVEAESCADWSFIMGSSGFDLRVSYDVSTNTVTFERRSGMGAWVAAPTYLTGIVSAIGTPSIQNQAAC